MGIAKIVGSFVTTGLLCGAFSTFAYGMVAYNKHGFVVSRGEHVWFVKNNGSVEPSNIKAIAVQVIAHSGGFFLQDESNNFYSSMNGIVWNKIKYTVKPSVYDMPSSNGGLSSYKGVLYRIGFNNKYCASRDNGNIWACYAKKFTLPPSVSGDTLIDSGGIAGKNGRFFRVYDVLQSTISGEKRKNILASGGLFSGIDKVTPLPDGFFTKSSGSPLIVGNYLVSYKAGNGFFDIGLMNLKTLKFSVLKTKHLKFTKNSGTELQFAAGTSHYFVVGPVGVVNPKIIVVRNGVPALAKFSINNNANDISFNGKMFLASNSSPLGLQHRVYISKNAIAWRPVE